MKQLDEAAIFNAARKIDVPGERDAYLQQACEGDPFRYQQICTLLRAYDEDPGFLESPHIETCRSIDGAQISEGPGIVIGRYKLLELIGEGGFAVVYMAEQQEPVRRTVALKLIKLGMDTKQVIARFEAERQALAMMDHPGIAGVHDAGATPTGRPYFVMQLIRGVPITEYCDQKNLPTKQRLHLFADVCHAVQHAHQKGIVHRDIKPTNVLVSLHDGKPVPKVIDFGIAKATCQRLTEKTLYTNYRQIIGTPQYMSPEQAEFSDLDIDTRSDIYSLGVLLYELLTSATPLKPDELHRMNYDEICRHIRRGDLLTPSGSLGTLGDAITKAAGDRQTDPSGLRKLLRGDLDWVVMKALEKDRSRRYESADALVADIQRYLADEPVRARPPSTLYRLRKFGRKYRMQVAALITLVAMLTFGLVLSAVALVRIDHERDQAQDNLRVAQQLIRDVLLPASDRLGYVADAEVMQRANADMLDQAIPLYERILAQVKEDPYTRLDVARVCNRRAGFAFNMGEPGESFCRRAIFLLDELVADFPAERTYPYELAQSHQLLAQLQWGELRWKEASQHYRAALNIFGDLVERFPSEPKYRERLLETHGSLAYVLQHAGGAWADAKESIERSMAMRAGGDPMDWILLAMAQWKLDEHAAALETYAQAEEAIASGKPILYLEMGVLGFLRLRAEAAELLGPGA